MDTDELLRDRKNTWNLATIRFSDIRVFMSTKQMQGLFVSAWSLNAFGDDDFSNSKRISGEFAARKRVTLAFSISVLM
jgi:hypothetical protein